MCFVGSSNRLSQAPISCYGFCSSLVINSCSLQTHVVMITNCNCYMFCSMILQIVFMQIDLASIFFLSCFAKFQKIELQGTLSFVKLPFQATPFAIASQNYNFFRCLFHLYSCHESPRFCVYGDLGYVVDQHVIRGISWNCSCKLNFFPN